MQSGYDASAFTPRTGMKVSQATTDIRRMGPITNDDELREAVAEASVRLQEIQHYLGRAMPEAGRVRFPRGYLRTAHEGRKLLAFVRKPVLRTNLSYSLMLWDVHLWILGRTDLTATARDMVVKANLALAGGLVEAMLADHYHGKMGKRQKFTSRTRQLVADGVIGSTLKNDLDWLWGMRNRQHLFEIDDSEFYAYTSEDHGRSIAAVAALIDALSAHSALSLS